MVEEERLVSLSFSLKRLNSFRSQRHIVEHDVVPGGREESLLPPGRLGFGNEHETWERAVAPSIFAWTDAKVTMRDALSMRVVEVCVFVCVRDCKECTIYVVRSLQRHDGDTVPVPMIGEFVKVKSSTRAPWFAIVMGKTRFADDGTSMLPVQVGRRCCGNTVLCSRCMYVMLQWLEQHGRNRRLLRVAVGCHVQDIDLACVLACGNGLLKRSMISGQQIIFEICDDADVDAEKIAQDDLDASNVAGPCDGLVRVMILCFKFQLMLVWCYADV